MSTSGSNTGQLRSYTARQILERALRQAGVKPAQFTSEMVAVGFDVFNTMLEEMLNLGMQLWARDRVIVPMYVNRITAQTPIGTSVVIDVQQRTLMRPTPTLVESDQGGLPLAAFDGDLTTSCTQDNPLGMITAWYPPPGLEISSYGIFFTRAALYGWMVEYTVDNMNWLACDAASVPIQAGEWVWRELDGMPSNIVGMRLRSVTPDVPLSIGELYFGNMPTDIPMGVITKDDYDAQPDKTSAGPPWTWYQDRILPAPVLYLWPRPNDAAKFLSLVVRRRRFLDQLTDMSQTLDISPRWNEGITSSMARRLCKEIPEANMQRLPMLLQEEARDMALAVGEERDPAPERYNPGLEVYSL
jgi:hypothetical protein